MNIDKKSFNILDLYNNISEINYIEYSKNPYSKALFFKSGNKAKLFNIEEHYKLLFELDQDEFLKEIYFLTYSKKCFFIPIEFIDGTIYGFQLRSIYEKKFYNYKLNDKYPFCFGLQDLNDFEYGKPIILSEGIKDVMTVKLFYKYSLAYLTAKPSDKLFDFLRSITNKICFIGDVDKAGKNLLELKIKDENKRKYKYCSKYYLMKKDAGEYFDTDNKLVYKEVEFIVDNIKNNEFYA